MTVSASPHFGSIPLWQVKPPKSIAHMVHIRVLEWERPPKNLSLREWLTSMTDTFWFHICWNVESVTWPLWYRMIYRALTPVANVFGEGTGRPTLQVDSVDQPPQQNGLRFHSEVSWPVTFVVLVGSLSSNVKLFLFLRLKERKAGKNYNLMDIQCLHTDNAIWRK